MQIHKHPHRYPKHKGDKGQVFAGECNRTACKAPDARWFNKGTYGYYCAYCASRNHVGDSLPMCVEVDHQLTIHEMDQLAYADARERHGSTA